MKGDDLGVAVIGATGETGREVRRALRERQFPVREWRLVSAGDESDDLDDDAHVIEDLERADLNGIDVVFMCASPEITRTWVPIALAAPALIIDATHAFADDHDVPLVVPEVNGEIVRDGSIGSVVSNPVCGAIALSVVLKPLEQAAGLTRVVVASYHPAASVGMRGVEELSRQTTDLMNGRSTETDVFPHRMAFNVIPRVGSAMADGVSDMERRIESQTRRLLGLPELPITVSTVHVPTFYGEAYAVNVETEGALDAAAARAILRESPGIILIDEPEANAYPTLTEALDGDATFVGRLRDDHSVRFGLNLWVVIDGSRKGGAVNAVQIAELVTGGAGCTSA